MKTIDCFIPYSTAQQVANTISLLKEESTVKNIFLCTSSTDAASIDGCSLLVVDSLKSREAIFKIASVSTADYTMLYTKQSSLELGYLALNRMIHLAEDSQGGMVYSDYYTYIDGVRSSNPVIAYQKGSLRDDFNFGSVLLFHTDTFKKAAQMAAAADYKFAALYDIRLKISTLRDLIHINEYLYTEVEQDTRKSGEKQFDYVDPKNRALQIEMEQACSDHLKRIGGYLAPKFSTIEFNKGNFEVEASVIIPVRNRIKTIKDAIESVLMQKSDFSFNLIIIDNHSTDGTSELIDSFSDQRLIHIVPQREDLGIGGCWNVGVMDPRCGKFAVQLDSDDVYSSDKSLAAMVKAFYDQNCAMVVGTYQMTDFAMRPIPPGVIDHREWTPENGRNNALRINGLGAPRAFYTPILREIQVPNTSYGEDYALGLYFSRHYQIGRVYEVVYNCRRWDDNSDAALDIVKMNGHNTYKDRIRTWELQARIALNDHQ